MFKMSLKSLWLILFLIAPTYIYSAENKMLAVVNDNFVIFDYDVDKKIKFLKVISTKSTPADPDIKALILNEMINNYLIIDDSKKYKITVSSQEVMKYLENMEVKNNYQKGGLIKKAEAEGLTKEEFFTFFKEELIVDKMKQMISFGRAKVSDSEINAELKRVLNLNGKKELLLYEISVSFSNKSQDEAKDKIYFIYSRLESGENFNTLARNFSEGINSKTGGEIGWVPEVFLSTEFNLALRTLSSKKYTKPFIIGNNYKIIFLHENRPLLYIDINNKEHMDQLNNFAKNKIIYDKGQVYLEDYLKEIYQKASITIYK